MDRESPGAAGSEGKITEAWIGREVMLETTEALSSDLGTSAPVYLDDVNERGVVVLVTRHKDQSRFSRYFYPWSVVGWIRLAEEDERSEPRGGSSWAPAVTARLGETVHHPPGGAQGPTLALGIAAGEPRVQWGRGIPDNG